MFKIRWNRFLWYNILFSIDIDGNGFYFSIKINKSQWYYILKERDQELVMKVRTHIL